MSAVRKHSDNASLHDLLVLEKELWDGDFSFVAGVDEAGRGPLAGPVVAAAVIFPRHSIVPEGINDSKKLTEKQRDELREAILSFPGIRYAIVEISAEEIDRINILASTHKAMADCLKQLPEVQFALVDGLPVKGLPVESRAIVKGDSKSASIAAASILAKTTRDALMMQYALQYPEYGFDEHKGYGTESHIEAIQKYGPCPIHRKTFSPIKEILNPPTHIQGLFDF